MIDPAEHRPPPSVRILLLGQQKRVRQIAQRLAPVGFYGCVASLNSGQNRQSEALHDKTQNRCRVVRRMVDITLPGKR